MATDWSDEAKARRSAAAKKAAETRKANQRNKALAFFNDADRRKPKYPYIQNSRLARWALSGVSVIAMIRGAQRTGWNNRTFMMRHTHDVSFPQGQEILRG